MHETEKATEPPSSLFVKRGIKLDRDLSNDNKHEAVAELTEANLILRESLKRCQVLVAECREKLAEKGEQTFLTGPVEHSSAKRAPPF